ncbi:MAG: SDR family NAD(P)-dependent oxidoreductase [Candidatus Nanohaloarchaea archaeon]
MIKDMIVLVTGATGGIGPHITDRLSARGAEVIGTYINEDEKTAAEKRSSKSSGVSYYRVDLTVESEVEELRAKIEENHGELDGIVNLVGGFSMAPLEDTTKEKLTASFELQAVTVFNVIREFREHLETGSVINFSSQRALNSEKNSIGYNVGKTAVKTITETANKELGARVNALAPDIMDTQSNRDAMPDADYSEWTGPEQVAYLVEFLLSGKSSAVSGEILEV